MSAHVTAKKKKVLSAFFALAAVLGLALGSMSSTTTVISGASGGSSAVDEATVQALRQAGIIDGQTYRIAQEAVEGTSVPWQVVAVLAAGKTTPSTPSPTSSSASPSATPSNSPSPSQTSAARAEGKTTALAWAMSQAGKPYRHSGPNPSSQGCGSRGPDCFDCSGLTSMAFKHTTGIDIGATPAAQYNGYASYGGQRIDAADPANLRPGDLVFWDDDGNLSRISHVAFYLGNGEIFDAANPSWTIGKRSLNVYDKTLKRLPYAIRVSGASDGSTPTPVETPQTPQASPSLPTFTGGNGRFHLTGVEGAENTEKAARFIAKRLNGIGFGADIRVSSEGKLAVATDGDEAETESKNKEKWVAAIGGLPVSTMSKDKAARVYETARRWKLGQIEDPPASGGPQCTITSAKPDGLDTTDGTISVSRNDGSQKFTLSSAQVRNAKALYEAGVKRHATYNEQIALLEVGLVESRLRVLANNGKGLQPYCKKRGGGRLTSSDVAKLASDSQALPHDGLGGDCDSMGIFQQRPLMGWGTVEQTMSIDQSVANFLGSEDSVASSGGMRKIPGAADMDPGVVAQKVQRSGVPDAYGKWSTAARDLVASMGTVRCTDGNAPPATGGGAWVRPAGMDVSITSPFGCRALSINGGFHTGVDFGGSAAGKPIYAASSGKVAYVLKDGQSEYYSGAAVLIDHGGNLYTIYNHMSDSGVKVSVGQQVNAGDQIAAIGNAGRSSGPHLHFGVIRSARPLVPRNQDFLNPVEVLTQHGVDVWGKQKPIVQKTTLPCR